MADWQLAWPWLAVLTPLPWVVWKWWPQPDAMLPLGIKVPYFRQMQLDGQQRLVGRSRLILLSVVWLLCIFAALRPQWVDAVHAQPKTGRDLMLAVDLSGSMDTKDMFVGRVQSNRLEVVKRVAGEFIRRREGDRVGLIVFGSRAYMQTPLTFDTETTATLLQETEIGLAGRETAIGDAVGLAVKRLREQEAINKVLILLTDGANTAGEVSPLEATEFAAREGMKIYTVGVGADEMLVRDLFGVNRINPSAELDEITLTAMAERTNGKYFRARSPDDLNAIYAEIDALEPLEVDQEILRPVREMFFLPLLAAFTLFLSGMFWLRWRGAGL